MGDATSCVNIFGDGLPTDDQLKIIYSGEEGVLQLLEQWAAETTDFVENEVGIAFNTEALEAQIAEIMTEANGETANGEGRRLPDNRVRGERDTDNDNAQGVEEDRGEGESQPRPVINFGDPGSLSDEERLALQSGLTEPSSENWQRVEQLKSEGYTDEEALTAIVLEMREAEPEQILDRRDEDLIAEISARAEAGYTDRVQERRDQDTLRKIQSRKKRLSDTEEAATEASLTTVANEDEVADVLSVAESEVIDESDAVEFAASIDKDNYGLKQAGVILASLRLRYPTYKFQKRVSRTAKSKQGVTVPVFSFSATPRVFRSEIRAREYIDKIQKDHPNSAFAIIQKKRGEYSIERSRLPDGVRPELDGETEAYNNGVGKAIMKGRAASVTSNTKGKSLEERKAAGRNVIQMVSPKGERMPLHGPSITTMGFALQPPAKGSLKESVGYRNAFTAGYVLLIQKGWAPANVSKKYTPEQQAAYLFSTLNISPSKRQRTLAAINRSESSAEGFQSERDIETTVRLLQTMDETDEIFQVLYDAGMSKDEASQFALREYLSEDNDSGISGIDGVENDAGLSTGYEKTDSEVRFKDELTGEVLHPKETLRDSDGNAIEGTSVYTPKLDSEGNEVEGSRVRNREEKEGTPKRGHHKQRVSIAKKVKRAGLKGMSDRVAMLENLVSTLQDRLGLGDGPPITLELVPSKEMGGLKGRILFAEGTAQIQIDPALVKNDLTKAVFITGHEMGHYVYRHTVADASKDKKLREVFGKEAEEYKNDFEEWFADKFSSWVAKEAEEGNLKNQSPLLEKAFKQLLDKLKVIYTRVTTGAWSSGRAKSSADFNSWMDAVLRKGEISPKKQRGAEQDIKHFTPRSMSEAIRDVTRQDVVNKAGKLGDIAYKFSASMFTGLYQLREISAGMADAFSRVFANDKNEFRRIHGKFNKLVRDNNLDEKQVTEALHELRQMEAYDEAKASDAAKMLRSFLDEYWRELKQDLPTLGWIDNYVPQRYHTDELSKRSNEFVEILVKYARDEDGKALYDADSAEQVRRVLVEGASGFEFALEAYTKSTGPGFDARKTRVLRDPELIAKLDEAGFMYPDGLGVIHDYLRSASKRRAFEREFSGLHRMNGSWGLKSATSRRAWLAPKLNSRGYGYLLVDSDGRQRDIDDVLRSAVDFGLVEITEKRKDGEVSIDGVGFYSPTLKLDDALTALAKSDELKAQRAKEIIDGFMGRLYARLPEDVRRWQANVMAYQAYLTLAFSTFSSLPDFVGPVLTVMRQEGVKEAYAALQASLQAVKRDGKRIKQVTEDIGLIAERMVNADIRMAFGQGHGSEKANAMLEKLFKYNGQEYLTKMSRVYSWAVGEQYFKSLAKNNNRQHLTKYGITKKDVEQWDGVETDSEVGRKMTDALMTFVDESVINPDATQKPVWANDPRFALLWQLKSFFWAYWSVVVAPTAKYIGEKGVKAFLAADLKTAGKYAAEGSAALAMTAMMMLPLAALGWELREVLQYGSAPFVGGSSGRTDRMDGWEYTSELISRAGLHGPFELATGLIGAHDPLNSAAFTAGPAFDHLNKILTGSWDEKLYRSIPVLSQLPAAQNLISGQFD